MTGALATPRYSAEDFETASIRSAAPSYVSEAPSYHSVAPYPEVVPPYSPPASRNVASGMLLNRDGASTPRQVGIGLPPVPNVPTRSIPNLNDFRIATWSTSNSPTSRLYQSVAQRRVSAQRDPVDSLRRAMTDRSLDLSEDHHDPVIARPLEDPYLVGEVAAARNRRERLLRESGDDILIREDRQWDWFLARIKDQDDRERSPPRIRPQPDMGQRKKLLRRIGGRRLM